MPHISSGPPQNLAVIELESLVTLSIAGHNPMHPYRTCERCENPVKVWAAGLKGRENETCSSDFYAFNAMDGFHFGNLTLVRQFIVSAPQGKC